MRKTRIRFTVAHNIDDQVYKAGDLVEVQAELADWLIEKKLAVLAPVLVSDREKAVKPKLETRG